MTPHACTLAKYLQLPSTHWFAHFAAGLVVLQVRSDVGVALVSWNLPTPHSLSGVQADRAVDVAY